MVRILNRQQFRHPLEDLDQVASLVLPALAHRVISGPTARLRDVSAERIVQESAEEVPVTGGDLTSKR